MPSPVPAEVLGAYGLNPDAAVRPLSGGMVNHNYTVSDGGREVVLQDMSRAFDPAVADDFEAVTTHLAGQGWEVPELVRTDSGQSSLPGEGGRFWRASTYLESDGKVPPYNQETMRGLGALLATFHVDMAKLDYEPKSSLPHFHDTAHFMSKLFLLQGAIPDPATRQLAAGALDQYRQNPRLPDAGEQLIHGDPRADNFLYRGGEPFTMVDFDTVMTGSPWMDIGDFLRSAGEEERLKGRSLGRAAVAAFCEAYREIARPDARPEEFYEQSLQAARLISLELAARFAIDTVENRYFAPPAGQDRRMFAAERAALQWGVYQDLKNLGRGDEH